MPKRLLMLEQWNLFSRALHLEKASSIQRQEMRRAFYAGAGAILFRAIHEVSDESDSTSSEIELVGGLYKELKDFAELVKQGRA